MPTQSKYDLIVIGAGNAGQAAAGVARKAGWSVAVIEAREVGGTCPLRGCVPKKVLVAAAETLDQIDRAGLQHIEVGPATLDWSALIAQKDSFIAPLPGSMEGSLTKRGIDVIHGRATLTGPNTVSVDGRSFSATHFVVAAGSKPRPLPIEGGSLMITSEQVLELPKPPESVVFVGAGVIALEFGHVFARVGTKVTILEVADRPLGNFDADAVGQLVAHSRSVGIDIHTNVRVERIAGSDGAFTVSGTRNGEPFEFAADKVVNGAGRVADVDALGLADAGVDIERGRPVLDAHLRSTSNPGIWFAGDALTGAPQLSPVATYEGKLVGRNLVGEDLETPDYTALPSAVFTIPTLAMVGLTEAQAAERGIGVRVKTTDMSGWLSGRTYAEKVAWAKILIDESTDAIVGAHLLGHGSAETIHTFALAQRYSIPANDLRDFIYVYPTFSNDTKYLV